MSDSADKNQPIQCPECGAALDLIVAQVLQLQGENEGLRKKLRALDQELNFLSSAFVASAIRNKFHRPQCVYAEMLLDSPNLIEFSTHQEAIDAGYKPCQTCCA